MFQSVVWRHSSGLMVVLVRPDCGKQFFFLNFGRISAAVFRCTFIFHHFGCFL